MSIREKWFVFAILGFAVLSYVVKIRLLNATQTPETRAMDKLLTTKEAADYLRTTPATLATWRCLGKGPEYTKPGKCVCYKQSILDAWIEARTVRPSEALIT
jgi:hypothetical protein